ncbi:hypothetical protein C427_5032 [Paraglaciecola psychrophila 170]|uniref:Uncharacterized protein n=1 Tax=Paraglaciecola psychrophila 170 TaxID=1129794 RepID=K7AAP1_9ALTE|nr:hypothetical protein C427_5032 [Paraglaciecola psychrophila 170]GAC39332.1 hypothetical protein GPSY_3721 [Paraglaciecola psychrophila 170]
MLHVILAEYLLSVNNLSNFYTHKLTRYFTVLTSNMMRCYEKKSQ